MTMRKPHRAASLQLLFFAALFPVGVFLIGILTVIGALEK